MSRREEKTDKADESAGIAQALAELIDKNRAQAVALKALGRLVDAQIAAAQEREAEQSARLGEVLDELAEAVAAVEIEKQKRIEAEGLAAELTAGAEVIRAALASFPTVARGKITVDEAAGVEVDAIPTNIGSAGEAETGDAEEGCVTPTADVHEERTLQSLVNVSETDAAMLEAQAVHAGAQSATDFAALLIREGLRRAVEKNGDGKGCST